MVSGGIMNKAKLSILFFTTMLLFASIVSYMWSGSQMSQNLRFQSSSLRHISSSIIDNINSQFAVLNSEFTEIATMELQKQENTFEKDLRNSSDITKSLEDSPFFGGTIIQAKATKTSPIEFYLILLMKTKLKAGRNTIKKNCMMN